MGKLHFLSSETKRTFVMLHNSRITSAKVLEDRFKLLWFGTDPSLENVNRKVPGIVDGEYNHRMAPYGMGCVAKTLSALGYVYEYRHECQRIYWSLRLIGRRYDLAMNVFREKASLASPDEANPEGKA